MLAFLLGSNPGYASLFGDSEAREQINALSTQLNDMEARFAKMEQTLGSQGLLELYSKVELLEQELGKLNGQIEMLTNENSMLQKRQRDFYIDLDNRLRHFEQPGSKKSALPPADSVNQSGIDMAVPPAAIVADEAYSSSENIVATETAAAPADAMISYGADENGAYRAAYDLFKNGEYANAIKQFESFLAHYPQSGLAPAAAYWIGNARYAMRDYQLAIEAQKQLIGKYPSSNKVPDAYLNMASSLYEMGDSKTSKTTLENLLAKYPNSEAAKKAKQRLTNFK